MSAVTSRARLLAFLLDLFVCHYVEWSPKLDLQQRCTLQGGDDRGYCPPRAFKGTHCTLYKNLGIDVNQTTLLDLAGRPQYLVEDHAQPMRELV